MFDVAGGADELVDFGFATVTRRFLRDRNDPPPLRYGVASGHRRFDGRRLGLGLTDRDHLPGVRPAQFAPADTSAAFSDFREILVHIFFGFFHLGSKRRVEHLPWTIIGSFNYVS
jgi:hypothetical protein